MGEYLRSIFLYVGLMVMVFTIAGFSNYYLTVASLKQDTYKNFMYAGMNKSVLRLEGASDLALGDVTSYYLDSEGEYTQLQNELIKQLGLTSKTASKVDYELLYDANTYEYFLYLEADGVESVIKFKLEDGRK